MAQQMSRFRIAAFNVLAIRAKLVVQVIALTFIGVVQPLHLHLKSCQALDCGSLWDATRT